MRLTRLQGSSEKCSSTEGGLSGAIIIDATDDVLTLSLAVLLKKVKCCESVDAQVVFAWRLNDMYSFKTV